MYLLPVSPGHGFGLSAGHPPGAGDELFLKIADLHPSNVLLSDIHYQPQSKPSKKKTTANKV